jgi:hypothetical protein
MNQSILFPDLQEWDVARKAVRFPAQQAGALIECFVTLSELSKLAGEKVEDSEQALKVFAKYRFDLEELAEELIEDEVFNQFGNIEVSC